MEKDIIDPIDSARHSIIIIGFSVATIICIIAIVASATLCGYLTVVVIILALLCISFCWICASFNVFFSIFIADM